MDKGAPSPKPAKSEPEQSRVVTGGLPRSIRAVLRGHWGMITHLAYAPDGSSLAAASSEGILSLWDLTGGRFVLKTEHRPERLGLPVGNVSFGSLAFAPDGGSLAYSYAIEGQALAVIEVLDIGTGQRRKIQFDDPEAKKGPMRRVVFSGLSFSPDGKTLAAGSANGIDLYDAATGRSRGFLQVEKRFYYSRVAYCPVDPNELVSCSFPWDYPIFDLPSRRMVHELEKPNIVSGEPSGRMGTQSPVMLAFSRDGARMAASTNANCLFLWDFKKRELVAAIREGLGSGWADGRCFIAFTPGGESLLTASRGLKKLDRVYVRKRDAATGELESQMVLVQPDYPFHMVYPLAIAPDGRSLVCYGELTDYQPNWNSLRESILLVYDLGGLYGDSGSLGQSTRDRLLEVSVSSRSGTRAVCNR
jgi:WD40 repeat protein